MYQISRIPVGSPTAVSFGVMPKAQQCVLSRQSWRLLVSFFFVLGWGACCSVPPLVAGEILPTIGDPQTTRTIAVVDSGVPVSFTGAANTAVANNVTQDDVPTSKKKQTADDPLQNEFGHFMRVRKDAKGKPLALETSVTRYILKNSAGENVVVDLIGVVHVGEQEYYEQLNKQFEQYDGLLYELVAPEGTRIPKGGRGTSDPGNPVAALQLGLKSVLELEFQLDHIDYTKENFIHADMTPEEFAESMERNEESIGKMLLKGIGQSMAMQSSGQSSDAEMLMAMFSNNRTQRMRRLMANQMQQIENGMVMFNGKEGSTIIEHRNAKVMDVLRKELNSGKKHVGIFYGAGHLPDMQRRLTSDFQARRAGQNWLKAWELNAK